MSTLPDDTQRDIEETLNVEFVSADPVSGGCISDTLRLKASTDETYFLKFSAASDAAAMFEAEADGLKALNRAGAVRVPSVLAAGQTRSNAWLLLEWLEPGTANLATWERLAHALVGVHAVSNDSFGWYTDNYIGSLQQDNTRNHDWPTFWRDRRIAPQLKRAITAGYFSASERKHFEFLVDRLGDVVATHEQPSLLHGDIWSGNVHVMRDGEAALIDPSVYFGHREVDLAMAMLFSGFPARFFDAYEEARPLADGFREVRVHAYQLYYVLVHVNLFGAGYVSQAVSLARRAGGG